MKKKTLSFTKEQVTTIVSNLREAGEGYSDLLKVMLEAMMRAERDEYNQEHNDLSNGYRGRKAIGQGKVMELSVPRTRYGNFYPVLLNVLKDQRAEMDRLGFLLYTKGLTTDQVGEVFGEIYGQQYSKQSVSRMADSSREEVLGWLERPLDAYYPILYIDCTFVPVRRDGAVRKEAFYSILGVKADRTREVLCAVGHPSESATMWRDVIRSLKSRGLKEVSLVVSDGLKSIEDAVASQLPGCDHQLCVVHLMREMAKKVPRKKRKELMWEVKALFQDRTTIHDCKSSHKQFVELCKRWSVHYKSFEHMATDSRYEHYFTFMKYRPEIRSMIYSTNWIERLNRDYKRVLRMRGALPNEKSVLVLMGSVAMTRSAYDRKLPFLDLEEKWFKWE